jgi:hypothetical protein
MQMLFFELSTGLFRETYPVWVMNDFGLAKFTIIETFRQIDDVHLDFQLKLAK